jgi:selenium metabolism protein YedF
MAVEKGLVLLVTSNRLGNGDDDLGEALIFKFLNELAGTAVVPERIIFLNSGVKLVADDSPAVQQLKKLEAAGVELLACGTCVEWFDLGERLAVGKQTTMTSVVAQVTAATKVVSL